MNIPDYPSVDFPRLCGHCAGAGTIESMDHGGTSVCSHCHGSGLEYSEPCSMCHGRGLVRTSETDSGSGPHTCHVCRGVGRMPNVRMTNASNPNIALAFGNRVREAAARSNGMVEGFREAYGMARQVSPRRRMGRGDHGLEGWDPQPQMSYEYAPPADADTATRPELNVEVSRRNLMSQSMGTATFRNCTMSMNPHNSVEVAKQLQEKALKCIKIAEHILHGNTNETEELATLLMHLPDSDVERVMGLLKINMQEHNVPPKALNRFQILKKGD